MKLYLNNFFNDLDLTFFYKLFEKTFNTKHFGYRMCKNK